jgi:L-ascorbate metabolism protein UlaG (beta-lactamase superfamily)
MISRILNPGAWYVAVAVLLLLRPTVRGQESPRFTEVARHTNGEVAIKFSVTTGRHCRLEVTDRLSSWRPLATLKSIGTNPFTDGGASFADTRFYRVTEVSDTDAFTGDHIATADGDVVVHPVNHASFVLRWNNVFVYNDPVGGSGPYQGLARPNLILVSHSHGDHFDASTLSALKQAGTLIIAPAAVYSSLSSALKLQTIPLANGSSTNVLGLTVEAIPAYNANHPKGVGNGYVVTLGGRRFFMSGDTGNIPEIRALANIEVAFLCMNIPFTMTVPEAVTATRAFAPRVMYPYHYRNQDGSLANLNTFKQQVGLDLGIEVRARKWY